jgi:flavin reductase (DIM6/NTAB) family NADH-FMN oxidoreductase RutF
MAVDPDELRNAMRQWATGVSVVTSVYKTLRHGMTVNSFTSVSLNPPLVLISLERQTRTRQLVEQAGIFGVTILEKHQQEVSDCFAGRFPEREDRFCNVDTYTLKTGASLISGGLAGLDCKVVSKYEAGTHTIFIGEVVALNTSPGVGNKPLLYYNRSYHELQK